MLMQASRQRAQRVTEAGRRAQIVAATIEPIAELGYRQASFAQIARAAGLSSTGLISYHFAGKSDLMAQVVDEIVGAISGHMTDRMAGCTSAAAALETYIRASAQ